MSTFVDRVRDHFSARPGQWVSAIELERIGGRQAWRTRVSDCRRVFGMTIQNRVRTIVEPDGRTWRLSEYRYVPTTSHRLESVCA